MNRRSFLQGLVPGAAALPFADALVSAAAPTYQVGTGVSADPYAATQRAVAASGQWPNMSGRPVLIKPNLVANKPSSSGVTTDPQVVRALVDLALESGASSVIVGEGGSPKSPANFAACGYDFFSTYNPLVQLMDFGAERVSMVSVPRGFTYLALRLATPALTPGLVVISCAKLKTHVNAVVSLSMKNLFSLASPAKYAILAHEFPRQDGHSRGIDLAAVDVNLTRPASFAVINGVWGLEGNGPLSGTPVPSNIAFAGANPLTTDRVALDFMRIRQTAVPHLAYAAQRGLGPVDTSTVAVLGDSYLSIPFTPAQTGPIVWRTTISPDPVSLSCDGRVIYYEIPQPLRNRRRRFLRQRRLPRHRRSSRPPELPCPPASPPSPGTSPATPAPPSLPPSPASAEN